MLYTIDYAVVGGGTISVATTRPETLFGDTAIAVHPQHPTLSALVGQKAVVPLCDRAIPIIADEHADPDKGTGAVSSVRASIFSNAYLSCHLGSGRLTQCATGKNHPGARFC